MIACTILSKSFLPGYKALRRSVMCEFDWYVLSLDGVSVDDAQMIHPDVIDDTPRRRWRWCGNKFLLWHLLPQGEKCLYIDCDIIQIRPAPLLETISPFAAVHELCEGLNAGLFIFESDKKVGEDLLHILSQSPNKTEQDVLRDYFPKYNRLPRSYNLSIRECYTDKWRECVFLHYNTPVKPWDHYANLT